MPPVARQFDRDCNANALLHLHIKSLDTLWKEYWKGIGNNKRTRLFTRIERGCVKYNYPRQKNAWDLITKLVDAGSSPHMAIQLIRLAYGVNMLVSAIIKCTQKMSRTILCPINCVLRRPLSRENSVQ